MSGGAGELGSRGEADGPLDLRERPLVPSPLVRRLGRGLFSLLAVLLFLLATSLRFPPLPPQSFSHHYTPTAHLSHPPLTAPLTT